MKIKFYFFKRQQMTSYAIITNDRILGGDMCE